jgi:Glycosyl transferases group 1
VLRVVAFPSDAYACGHYRIVWPADVLRQHGFEVFIMPPNGKTGFQVKVEEQPDGLPQLIGMTAPECDIVVLQRPAHYLQPQLIQGLQKAGIAVVVDMDDDMSRISQHHMLFHHYRTHTNKNLFSWRNAARSCSLATFVTTTTPALQRTYARPGRGMVIDNYVPEAVLRYENVAEHGFGWAGSVGSHPDDLQVTGGAVQRVMDAGHKFTIVGDGKGVRPPLRLREEPPATGGVELINWVKTIASSLQVGMVPLAPTAFNTAKSRLKGIEYMAAGVPWVASPREEYRRLNRESGCGLLADSPRQWVDNLTRLLTDDVLRKEQVEMGREYMKGQTYQANAWRFAEAWMRALEIQRAQ